MTSVSGSSSVSELDSGSSFEHDPIQFCASTMCLGLPWHEWLENPETTNCQQPPDRELLDEPLSKSSATLTTLPFQHAMNHNHWNNNTQVKRTALFCEFPRINMAFDWNTARISRVLPTANRHFAWKPADARHFTIMNTATPSFIAKR